jgi:hypothetical protein
MEYPENTGFPGSSFFAYILVNSLPAYIKALVADNNDLKSKEK